MSSMKGRAEREDVTSSQLFESGLSSEAYPLPPNSAGEMYPFAATGKGIGMIIGDRGCGKTFFVRKLAMELPGKIYGLDKDTLEYGILDNCQNPRFIAVDDLHYQIRAMKLNNLIGKPNDEGKILERLCGFKEEAQTLGVPLVFISDEGPAGLYTRFKDEANQKKFLGLLEGCVSTTDDTHRFYQHLGKYYIHRDNCHNFRNSISHWLAFQIKKNLNITEIPLIVFSSFLRPPLPKPFRKYPGEAEQEWKLAVQAASNNYDMNSVYHLKKKEWCGIRYELEIPFPKYQSARCTLIRPIRELKVLADELKAINRETLGIDFGEKAKDGYCYFSDEVLKISNIIEAKYSHIAQRTYLPLAKALLSTGDDNKIRAYMLKHNLLQD